jgi:hypothetical protein
MKLFPSLREIDFPDRRNPSYLHSLWLGIYVPIMSLPEIMFRAIWPRVRPVLTMYGAAIFITVSMLGQVLWLLWYSTMGTFWTGLWGYLNTKEAGAEYSGSK